MFRKLRLLVTAAALLLGLFGATVAFAATSSAAEAGHSTAVSVFDKATAGSVRPNASSACQVSFPSRFEFDYICTVFSGQLELFVTCGDGSTIRIPLPGPGTYSGRIVCPSGIIVVRTFAIG